MMHNPVFPLLLFEGLAKSCAFDLMEYALEVVITRELFLKEAIFQLDEIMGEVRELIEV